MALNRLNRIDRIGQHRRHRRCHRCERCIAIHRKVISVASYRSHQRHRIGHIGQHRWCNRCHRCRPMLCNSLLQSNVYNIGHRPHETPRQNPSFESPRNVKRLPDRSSLMLSTFSKTVTSRLRHFFKTIYFQFVAGRPRLGGRAL